MTLDAFLQRLGSVSRVGDGYQAHCPAHDDRQASLSVTEGADGRILVKCFANCSIDSILAHLGLATADLFPDRPARRIVATYDYHDERGDLLFQVVRYEPKDFRQRRPDGHGGWLWKLKGVRLVPYGYPELLTADPTQPVFVAEGEKDCETLRRLGAIATTNPGGANKNKWRKEFSRALQNRHVIVLADNDESGRLHATRIASGVLPFAASVKVLDSLPGVSAKGDVSDYIASGHTLADLLALVEQTPRFESPRPTPDDPTSFKNTEVGDAEMFATMHGDYVRKDKRRDQWLILGDGGIWTPDRVDQVFRLATDTIRERQRRATQIEDADRRQKALSWALAGESRARLSNLIVLASTIPPIPDDGESWDLDPWLLGCANGVVDLRTGTLRKGRPDDRITFSTRVEFDPEARSELWEQTLEQIFPHAGLIDFMQRCLGYTATGDTKCDKWFLSWGGGRNGKGTVYGAVRAALGDYALELPSAALDRRRDNTPYDLAKLPGRRFVTSAESGDTLHLNHDRIKFLSGGDRLRAADKYERSFEFTPACKLWLACNKKPRVTDDTLGFWSRVLLIPFTASFAGHENFNLRVQLQSEPGHQRAVLAWLVRGASHYVEQGGLGVVPAVVSEATDAYRQESEPLADFYESCCIVNSEARVKAGALRDAYLAWAQRSGFRFPLGTRSFGEAVSTRFERKERNDGKWYVGLGLRDEGTRDSQFELIEASL